MYKIIRTGVKKPLQNQEYCELGRVANERFYCSLAMPTFAAIACSVKAAHILHTRLQQWHLVKATECNIYLLYAHKKRLGKGYTKL